MNAKEIFRCALQIEKSSASRSYGEVLTLLCDLDKSQVTLEQLEKSDVDAVLRRLLKTCSDSGVKTAARALLSKWKNKDVKGPRPSREVPRPDGALAKHGESSSGQAATSEAAEEEVKVAAEQESPSVTAQDGTSESTDFSPVRAKCVQLLLTALRSESPDQSRAAELAADVERRIHGLHTSSEARYKSCVRSKVANLRNPRNGHLRQGLASGALSAEAFACMSAEEMAGNELRQLRERYSAEGVRERQLPAADAGTETGRVRCRRCGGSDCRVTQVSRGALFLPAWVRPGGPDDDAMTFVTCGGCGQQWYHSGWVCF